jgi:hypothetical protein
MGVDDFLGIDPGVLVRNVIEAKVNSFVLDHNGGSCQRAGSGGGRMEESKEESSRMEMTKLTSGCVRGTKVRAEDHVDKTD